MRGGSDEPQAENSDIALRVQIFRMSAAVVFGRMKLAYSSHLGGHRQEFQTRFYKNAAKGEMILSSPPPESSPLKGGSVFEELDAPQLVAGFTLFYYPASPLSV